MKDRISELHRQSSEPQSQRPDSRIRNGKATPQTRRAIPWGFLTFLLAALFFVWRIIPVGNGYLPDSMTYPAVMGRQEGAIQGEAAKAAQGALAAAEKAKAEAVSPVEVAKATSIASQTAPIEIQKTVTITAEQARIEQVKSCRQAMMQGAGQAYATCIASGFEAGAECDARREIILEKLPDCGSLPGETPPSSNGSNP